MCPPPRISVRVLLGHKESAMPQSTTRRTIVAVALVSPLAAARSSALAQSATPSPSDGEAIVRSFSEPFNTGDTNVYDTILAEDWVDTPLGPGQQPGRAGFSKAA
jgi:hypothetical protein